MKKIIVLIGILITIFTCKAQSETDQVILHVKKNFVNEELIKPGISTGNAGIDSINRFYNAINVKKVFLGKEKERCSYVVKFPEGTDLREILLSYEKTGVIEYAEPDHILSIHGFTVVPNDEYYPLQWSLKNNGDFPITNSRAGADIDMENGWDIETGSSDIIVAVIDAGIKLDHPEFEGRIWINQEEVAGNGSDDDGNGFVDDIYGWNFAYDNNDVTDDNGHGTAVAGVIGANGNNGIGFAGVDLNCKIMTVKAMDEEGRGYSSWTAQAVYYAAIKGAHIINMSLGGFGNERSLEEAIGFAYFNNVTLVAAMGNENIGTPQYPAAYEYVIAVGASNPIDRRANPFYGTRPPSGSSYGSHISVIAPGDCIYVLDYRSNNNYGEFMSGTSFASPIVAGIASLLKAQDRTRTPDDIRALIENNSEDRVGHPNEDLPGWDQYYGHGRVNAYRSLANVTNSIADPGENSPKITVFPNPSNEQVSVIVPPQVNQLRLLNSVGQTLDIRNTEGGSREEFVIENPGLYLIQAFSGNDIYTAKIVIQ